MSSVVAWVWTILVLVLALISTIVTLWILPRWPPVVILIPWVVFVSTLVLSRVLLATLFCEACVQELWEWFVKATTPQQRNEMVKELLALRERKIPTQLRNQLFYYECLAAIRNKSGVMQSIMGD